MTQFGYKCVPVTDCRAKNLNLLLRTIKLDQMQCNTSTYGENKSRFCDDFHEKIRTRVALYVTTWGEVSIDVLSVEESVVMPTQTTVHGFNGAVMQCCCSEVSWRIVR